jgi:predicted site-specific integrase-resolvase
MTKIIKSDDCGNSPKNLLVESISIALALGDGESLSGSVTDDIRWNMIGSVLLQGRKSFSERFKQVKNDKVTEIVIQHVATHGKSGAVNGTKKLKSGKTYAFRDVYEFSGAKGTSAHEITSYVIELIAS